VGTDTLFQAASISKPVTAMAAMRLADEHRLSVDADINTILKSWHVPGSSVTPRSLMSHTSGADDGFGCPGTTQAHPGPQSFRFWTGSRHRTWGRCCLRGRHIKRINTQAAA
jgi:CubicO group peptidase (beta-lactamase class C family)